MNTLSPSFYFILLCFMIFPLISGGKLNQSGAKIVASFIVTIFCSPFLIMLCMLALYSIL